MEKNKAKRKNTAVRNKQILLLVAVATKISISTINSLNKPNYLKTRSDSSYDSKVYSYNRRSRKYSS